MKTMKKLMSVILFAALCLCAVLTAAGCQEAPVETTAPETPVNEVSFTLIVIDGEGKETTFQITTTKATVGEALLEEKLIEGEQGDYGMYIKSVNGISADYDKDGTYWGFYVDGEYALSGVDTTEIAEGSTYTLKVEKGN